MSELVQSMTTDAALYPQAHRRVVSIVVQLAEGEAVMAHVHKCSVLADMLMGVLELGCCPNQAEMLEAELKAGAKGEIEQKAAQYSNTLERLASLLGSFPGGRAAAAAAAHAFGFGDLEELRFVHATAQS